LLSRIFGETRSVFAFDFCVALLQPKTFFKQCLIIGLCRVACTKYLQNETGNPIAKKQHNDRKTQTKETDDGENSCLCFGGLSLRFRIINVAEDETRTNHQREVNIDAAKSKNADKNDQYPMCNLLHTCFHFLAANGGIDAGAKTRNFHKRRRYAPRVQ
jgi:hypothetical protein